MFGRKRIATLEAKIDKLTQAIEASNKKKNIENASYELKEFLADVMEHGCGIVKIHPDSIFIRGIRQ